MPVVQCNLPLKLSTLTRHPSIVPSIFISMFLLVGFTFVPQAGIEDDEALLVSGVYVKAPFSQEVKILRHRVPIMLMSYVGALKSWLYAPILSFWNPSSVSLRVPTILTGCLTIWLFHQLLRRIAGALAAMVGCVVLATDTSFLLTTCFDWGPSYSSTCY